MSISNQVMDLNGLFYCFQKMHYLDLPDLFSVTATGYNTVLLKLGITVLGI